MADKRTYSMKPLYWTPARNAKLRELWERQPMMRISDIRVAMGSERSVQAISKQAQTIGLKQRRTFERGLAAEAPRQRPSRAGQDCAPVAETKPRPRAPAPLEAPCPFYLGGGRTCGVMVNRRPDAAGNKPSQYCREHKARVLPISKGALGNIRSEFLRGPARKVRA